MKNQRPNIVLMVSDDHGHETLGCYGNRVINTPHLDRLARDGARIEIVRNGEVVWRERPVPVEGSRFEVEFRDEAPLDGTFITPSASSGRPPFTYYYVRVVQDNGPQAWGSPVWVAGA